MNKHIAISISIIAILISLASVAASIYAQRQSDELDARIAARKATPSTGSSSICTGECMLARPQR